MAARAPRRFRAHGSRCGSRATAWSAEARLSPRPSRSGGPLSGAWAALRLAVNGLIREGKLTADPIQQQVAAVSCGIYKGTPVLDLDYDEDSAADADANFVLLADGKIAEAQATAE